MKSYPDIGGIIINHEISIPISGSNELEEDSPCRYGMSSENIAGTWRTENCKLDGT